MDQETRAVSQAQAGDAEAFRVIVDSYGPVLFRTAFLLTRDPEAAEDAAQEAFLKAWRGIGSFRAGTNLRAWLVRILVNHINGTRRRRLLPVIRFTSEVAERPDTATPETILVSDEDSADLLRLLDSLRQDERTVIVMHYYLEMSLSEIELATGWRTGTVRSRLSRGLGRLRERISQTGHRPAQAATPPVNRSVRLDGV
jgi:RNA polymerase sigma-70 factor (ECF subfamily)